MEEDESDAERSAAARKAAAEESDDDENQDPRSKWTKGGDFESEDDEPAPKKGKGAKKQRALVEGEEGQQDGFTLIGKGGKAFEATPETLFKKLRELLEARGKKVRSALQLSLGRSPLNMHFSNSEHRQSDPNGQLEETL